MRPYSFHLSRIGVVLALVFAPIIIAAPSSRYVERDSEPLYTDFLDRGFPFIEATLDLRGIAPSGTQNNLVPRGVILPLDDNTFVCFDTELLRVAAIWQGDFITADSMAMISYEEPMLKSPPGQTSLPKPVGEVKSATGLYPGWQASSSLAFADPRSRGVDPKELGRGPLPKEWGAWQGIEDSGKQAILRYSLFGSDVKEVFEYRVVSGVPSVTRTIELDSVDRPLTLILGDTGDGASDLPQASVASGVNLIEDRYQTLSVAPSARPQTLSIAYPLDAKSPLQQAEILPTSFSSKQEQRWQATSRTRFELGEPQGAYAVDELALPYPNPWQRRIRPMAIAFFENGDAVISTFDGDIYRISGMGKSDDSARWQRIASGFNEPQAICVRGDDVFVFSRLGITRLVDRNSDGETDFYEMFCNSFTQSSETRDYPLSLVLRPDNGFYISKGGQQSFARSRDGGRVLSISPDGSEVEEIASGLRNAYINTHPQTGLLTASDQQGNWIPATPFHVIRPGAFYGFEPASPPEPPEVSEPVLWLPHRIAQSGIDQIWCVDPRQGPLQGKLLYVDYYGSRLAAILTEEQEPVDHAAGLPLPIVFKSPLLKGAINPTDGLPYFVGFQIFGSTAGRLEGLSRLRPVAQLDGTPVRARAFKEGVLLSFPQPIDPEKAKDPANYQASSWDYRRSEDYGSPQFKASGEPGVDPKMVHSVLVSEDRRSVFIAIEEMSESMQLEIQYQLFADEWQAVYFTPKDMPNFIARERAFAAVDFRRLFASEPAPRAVDAKRTIISVARGQELYTQFGCVGCHSIDGSTEGKTGPSWWNIFNRPRTMIDGARVKVDDDYLREAILQPNSKIVEGYGGEDAQMPSYSGILSESDIESLILYIRSLR